MVPASFDDQRVVLARTVTPSGALPPVQPGGVYVLDARAMTAPEVLALVGQINAVEAAEQEVAPPSALTG